MTDPVRVEVPHKLGVVEAKARVDRGIGKLAGKIPGATLVDHRWDGDVLHFTLAAMGQSVASTLDIRDTNVIALVSLPPFLAPFAGMVRDRLAKEAPRLLD